MSSYCQEITYRCAACEHHGERWTWLVIDASDQPELAEKLCAGRLRTYNCDQCCAELMRTTSLMFVPPKGSPILFAPDPEASEQLTREQLMASFAAARRDGRANEESELLSISHELMPVAASRELEDDLKAVRGGLLIADSDELQRYVDWLGTVERSRLERQLREAVTALTTAQHAAGFADVVRRYPVLLGEEADELLRAMQYVVDDEAGREYQRSVEEWRHLLRRCRRDGVEETLSRLRDT